MQVKSKSGRLFDVPSEAEDAQIRAGIASDPDRYELSDSELSTLRPIGQPPLKPHKLSVSLHLSPEVVAYFQATGDDWQARLDEVLKAYVNSHQ